jgi:hypothetical protein
MAFVGFKAVLTSVALLIATCPTFARAPDNVDLPRLAPHPWDIFFHDSPESDEHLAQQTQTDTQNTQGTPPPPEPPPAPGAEPAPDDVLPDLSGESGDDFSVGEIPAVETVELTPETARKAVEVYVLVRDKYKDAQLENYESLQDFVDKDPRGKDLETDVKSFDFESANAWNVAITTVGFAYSNLIDDQTEDIKQQIAEVKADTEMAQDMRDRMVQALSAMIPSDNNRKVVEELMKDPAYTEKLKQLETEEE